MLTCGAQDPLTLQGCTCSSVHELIREHGLAFDKKRGDEREVTYLDMCGDLGGQYCIPCGPVEDHFVALYIRGITLDGKNMYCIEKRSPVFRFFMDIDEKTYDPHYADVDRLEYVSVIQDDMRRFFPSEVVDADDLLKTVVCTATKAAEAGVDADGREFFKIGMHLHFPNLLVTDHEARLIRASAVVALEQQVPFEEEAEVEGGWETVLDDCVYGANGLRMLGSQKFVACKACKGGSKAERRTCASCKGSGKKPTGRFYCVQHVVGGDGEIDEEETRRAKEDLAYAMSLAKIRTPPDSVSNAHFRRYEGCPSYKREKENARRKTTAGRKSFAQDDESAKSIGLTTRKEQMKITPEIENVLTRLIKQVNPERYDRLRISDATWLGTAKSPCLCIRVTGEGSNWCCNVQRDHSQNSIYFMLTASGLVQRCFSRKHRSDGTCCSSYQSPEVGLREIEHTLLFRSHKKNVAFVSKAPAESVPAHKRCSSKDEVKEVANVILGPLRPDYSLRKPVKRVHTRYESANTRLAPR